MATLKKFYLIPLIALIGIIFFYACNNSSGVKTSVNQNTISAYDSTQGKSLTYTKYELPLSVDVYKFLKSKKIGYNLLLMHKIKMQDKYFTEVKRAFVLGIYSSDLAYAAINEQSKDAVDYFGVSIELANKLDIQDSYNSKTLDRAYDNLNNEDSLSYIAGESYWKSCSNLERNKRANILPFVIVGSWVESMHILTRNCIGSPPETGLFIELFQQLKHLDKLIAFLSDTSSGVESSGSKAEIENMLIRLKSIQEKYNKIDSSNVAALGLSQFKDVIFQIEDFRNTMLE